jgi:uncharacterized protein (TIGR03437 family)
VVEDLFVGPGFSAGQALVLTSSGKFVALGTPGSLWIETAAIGPSILATANSAAGSISGRVAPQELISLYGIGVGPQTAVIGEVQNGRFTSSLAGYQVLFDQMAAPLLYIGPTQINTIVPRAVFGRDSTHVQIATPSGILDGPTVELRPVAPGIFQNSQTGLAAALNEDGSVNSTQNPAKPGSAMTIFATGGGIRVWDDGILVPPDRVFGTAGPVSVLASTGSELRSLEVLYAGDAPGLVAGVMQINFRLPNPLFPGNTFRFLLQVRDVLGGGGTIAVSR